MLPIICSSPVSRIQLYFYFWLMNLINFFNCVKNDTPYISNVKGAHEKRIGELLTYFNIKHQFHPNGKQKAPDILLEVPHGPGFKGVKLELKSSQNAFPMWNSGLPQTDCIYIFGSKRYDSHTYFLGQDIITPLKLKQYSDLTNELREIVKQHQQKADWVDDRGFDYYTRPAHVHTGKANQTDFFKHKNRGICEQNVERMVLTLIREHEELMGIDSSAGL